MSAVRVEAPARLHLGMLAVAGDRGRRFGGLGVSVSRPAVVLEAMGTIGAGFEVSGKCTTLRMSRPP